MSHVFRNKPESTGKPSSLPLLSKHLLRTIRSSPWAQRGGTRCCCPQEAEGARRIGAGQKARLLQAGDSFQNLPVQGSPLWPWQWAPAPRLPALKSVTVCAAIPSPLPFLALSLVSPSPLYSFRNIYRTPTVYQTLERQPRMS